MKRKLIMDAGAAALASGGVSDLDLTRIAASAGLKPSSLRYYFRNREELAEALYCERLEELEAIVDEASGEATLLDCIRHIFAVEVRSTVERLKGGQTRRPQLGEIRSLEIERRRRLGQIYLRLLAKSDRMFERFGYRKGPLNIPVQTQILLENIFWIPAWIEHFAEWEMPTVIEQCARIVTHGFTEINLNIDFDTPVETVGKQPGEVDPFLKIASQLICERGYRGTSIDAIADRLGVTKGSFYHHNSEKEGLVERCFTLSYQRVSEFQRVATEASTDPLRRLVSVLRSIVQAQLDQDFPLMRTAALPGLPQELRRKLISAADPLDRWFVGEIARIGQNGIVLNGDPYIAAQCLLIGANATYDLARFQGYGALPTTVADHVELLLNGIAM